MTIARNKSMHTPFNYYLCSLSVSDMLILMSHISYQLKQMWIAVEEDQVNLLLSCVLFELLIYTASNASVLTIIAFTVERYLVICHPFNRKSELSEIVKYIMGIWVIAAVAAIPMCTPCICEYHNKSANTTCIFFQYIVSMYGLLFFGIPLLLLTVLYILIGVKIRKCREGIILQRNTSTDDTRIVKMLVVVVVVFFICWAPLWIRRILTVYDLLDEIPNEYYLVMVTIGLVLYYIATIINPVIYSVMSQKFRKSFKDTFGEIRNLKLSPIMGCCRWVQDNVWQGCYQVQLHTTTTTTTKWSLHNIYCCESEQITTEMPSCSSE